MQAGRFTDRFKSLYDLGLQLTQSCEADAVVLMLEEEADWGRLKRLAGETRVLVAGSTAEKLRGAKEAGLPVIQLARRDVPVYERLTQALLEAVADDVLAPGSTVVALYSGFEAGSLDTISVVDLGEHLGRLTGSDLRQLETRVPLDTLQNGGQHGGGDRPRGTRGATGGHDVRRRRHSQGDGLAAAPVGFDPVRGYSRKERNLKDARVREGIKEIAQMDGAIVVSADGTVEAACRYLDCPGRQHHPLQGAGRPALGRRGHQPGHQCRGRHGQPVQRHGADLSKRRGGAAGQPFDRRPMVWREFDFEPPASAQHGAVDPD